MKYFFCAAFAMVFFACSLGGDLDEWRSRLPSSELPVLTGTVSINGIPQVGQTLTADVSSLGGSGTISYQWKRGGSETGVTVKLCAVKKSSTAKRSGGFFKF